MDDLNYTDTREERYENLVAYADEIMGHWDSGTDYNDRSFNDETIWDTMQT